MDFNLTQEQPPEETVSRLNSAMPEGLRILKVYTPETKHTEIKQACYKILLSGANADIEKAFGDFMAQDRIITMKRTKRGGEKEIDLKPDIEVKEVVSVKDGTEIVLCLPAGNEKNINPSLVLESFEQFSGISFETERVERTGIFSENGKEFY
jgi:radical SAM-linked protein